MGEQKLSPMNWSESRSGSSWARWPCPVRTVASAAPGGTMAPSLLLLTPAFIGSATGLPARTRPPNAPSSGCFIRIHPQGRALVRPARLRGASRTARVLAGSLPIGWALLKPALRFLARPPWCHASLPGLVNLQYSWLRRRSPATAHDEVRTGYTF